MSVANRDALSGVRPVRPAYAQVASQIRELIMSGELSPGDRLPNESIMATQFGVSRTTVREALRVLSSQGLVITERGVTGGTFVSAGNPAVVAELLEIGLNVLTGNNALSVFELLECREMLEVPIAALAAQRRTADDIDRLERLLEWDRPGEESFADSFERHRQIHLAVHEAAQNRMFAVILDPLFGVLEGLAQRVYSEERQDQVHTEHRHLVDAIRDRDAARAAAIMKSHLEALRAVYADHDGKRPEI
jgi:GntR family transcriptional repressor for pyruvate dehydrogenase complex